MLHPFKEMHRYIQGNNTCHQFSKDCYQYLSSTIWHRADLHTWNRNDLSSLFSCISLKDERKPCWVYATLDWGFDDALLDPLAEGPASSPMGASFDHDLFAFCSSLFGAVASVRDVDGCAAPSFSAWFRNPLLSGLSANISSGESSSSSSIGGAGPLRRGLSFSPTWSNASISRLGIVSFSASLAVQVSSSFCLSLTSSPSCRPAAGVVGWWGLTPNLSVEVPLLQFLPLANCPRTGAVRTATRTVENLATSWFSPTPPSRLPPSDHWESPPSRLLHCPCLVSVCFFPHSLSVLCVYGLGSSSFSASCPPCSWWTSRWTLSDPPIPLFPSTIAPFRRTSTYVVWS